MREYVGRSSQFRYLRLPSLSLYRRAITLPERFPRCPRGEQILPLNQHPQCQRSRPFWSGKRGFKSVIKMVTKLRFDTIRCR